MERKKRTLIIIAAVSLVVLCIISVGIIQYIKHQQNNASSTSLSIILHVDYTRSEDERGNFSLLRITKIDTNQNISNILTLNNVSFNWVGYKGIYHENDYPHDNSDMVIIASGIFIDVLKANLSSPVIYFDNDEDGRVTVNDEIRVNLDHSPPEIEQSFFDLDLNSRDGWLPIYIESDNQWLEKEK